MWSKGIMGEDKPKQLLRTIFYLTGLHFALRGGEHRQLRVGPLAQIVVKTGTDGEDYLEYHQDHSKNNQGGLKHVKIKAKIVKAYSNSSPERCYVRLFKKYLNLRPSEAPNDFYLRELTHYNSECWYGKRVLGVNTLSKMVADMCKEGGIAGYKTNHSLISQGLNATTPVILHPTKPPAQRKCAV